MPYLAVASCPALQWVRSPIPGFTRVSACSPIFLQMSMSSCLIWRASSRRSARISGMDLPSAFLTTVSIRLSAHERLTAVGREEFR